MTKHQRMWSACSAPNWKRGSIWISHYVVCIRSICRHWFSCFGWGARGCAHYSWYWKLSWFWPAVSKFENEWLMINLIRVFSDAHIQALPGLLFSGCIVVAPLPCILWSGIYNLRGHCKKLNITFTYCFQWLHVVNLLLSCTVLMFWSSLFYFYSLSLIS